MPKKPLMKSSSNLSELGKIGQAVSKYSHRYREAKSIADAERRRLAKADSRCVYTEQAQQLTQEVAQTVQRKAHTSIASVVTRCLEAVFDDPYEFQIVFERKRGKTEARIVFLRGGHEIDSMGPGGGVIDVAAFALRLACLVLTRPPLRRVLVLDEPFRHLKPAETYGPRIVALLETLAKDFKCQFIMVQNLPEFQAGKIVRIEK